MISVIVTLHNRESSIVSALQSITAQTAQQWECVVVDNASNDASEYQVRSYLIDRRMRYLRLNKEISTAETRRIGLEQTKGEWVMFLDGADYLESNAMQALYLAVKKYGTRIAAGKYYTMNNGEKHISNNLLEGKFTSRQVSKGKIRVLTCNSIISRDIADKPELWDQEDVAYTHHIIAMSGELSEPLVKPQLPLLKRIFSK